MLVLIRTPITVNELSNTIDLQSTLIRAEGLFRRFQRTVEAIDKKNNFPAPSVRQRKPAANEDTTPKDANTTGTDAATTNNTVGKAVAQGINADKEKEKEKDKVISPELRQLLSRKVVKLDKAPVEASSEGT